MMHVWKPTLMFLSVVMLTMAVGCNNAGPTPPSEPPKNPGEQTPAEGTPTATPTEEGPATETPSSTEATKMKVERNDNWGTLVNGTKVAEFTLTNNHGIRVSLITWGARIISVETPDREGNFENITLMRDTLDDYVADNPYFGCTVGRYGNRIAAGKFTLDGVEYTLNKNEGAKFDDQGNRTVDGNNHLHGGDVGFDKHVWDATPRTTPDGVSVTFTRTSPDGEENYPGELKVAVTYTLNDKDELIIEYEATTDKATVVNLTNHAYWNLGGAKAGGILEHQLILNAPSYLPVDDALIPTGEVAPVKDTAFDFTTPHLIGERIGFFGEGRGKGYDHCYVLAEKKQGEEMVLAAEVVEPKSGRMMQIYTTEPAIQFYSGNFLTSDESMDGGGIGGGGVVYDKHHAFCLETQHYPDSPNKPDFPSTVLRPGETYRHKTVHKFSAKTD